MINETTAKLVCNDGLSLIENYKDAINDTTQTWCIHHRLETHFSDGTQRPKYCEITAKELKALDMYYNRPANEFIFLTRSDHMKLHNSLRKINGHKHTEETKRKMSEYWRTHTNIGRFTTGFHQSDETRGKISDYQRTHTNSGRFVKGRVISQDERDNLSKIISKLKWYNNGVINVRREVCPEGFVAGLLRKEN